jgi:hypothetical protein
MWKHGGAGEWRFVKRVPWWFEVEPPHSGAGGLTKAIEDDFPIFVDDGDGELSEGDCAVCVAEDAHAEEVVDEVGHDVHIGSAVWEVGKHEVAGGHGGAGVAVGEADHGGRRVVVALCNWSIGVAVVVAGACVGDGGEVWIVM